MTDQTGLRLTQLDVGTYHGNIRDTFIFNGYRK